MFREVRPDDLPALAALHVRAWNETYPHVKNPPTYELRERQWREQFAVTDGSWFCFVVENSTGELIGFAKGKDYCESELPEFSGELNKIYLLREHQRKGLGRKLMGHVVRRFLARSISTMVLFAEPQNPSCRFFETLGGERLLGVDGQFHGGYGWRDLRKLATLCSSE